jgi:uncharacterized protein YjbJ (UPF0337 family)
MTMNQQERDALSQNWDQVKSQIQSQFPDVSEQDLQSGQSNPDQLASKIASATGQDQNQVEQQLRQFAQQFQGRGTTGSQSGTSQ